MHHHPTRPSHDLPQHDSPQPARQPSTAPGRTLDDRRAPAPRPHQAPAGRGGSGRTETPELVAARLGFNSAGEAPPTDGEAGVRNSEATRSRAVVEQIRAYLTSTQGHNRVRRYISESVTIEQTTANAIEIAAGDRFTLDMIERRLGAPLRIAAQFALGTTDPRISYRVDEARRHPATAPAPDSGAGDPARTHPLASRLPAAGRAHAPRSPRDRFPACPSLGDFLVGASNRLALESVKQALQNGADAPPVFVHGACGVGKTHLLRGATQYARRLRPGCKVRYTTGEAFTNGFVTAIRTRTIDTFKEKYKGLDLLCIDDIHLMAGKQATQHELLQIFNTLSLEGARIILASDAHPREIERLDQALASRFASGLVVRIERPDQELARRLVPHIAHRRGMFLDEAGINTIVERVGIGRGASVRDLEGAVIQIQAVARMMDRSAHAPGADQDIPPRRGSLSPTMMQIRKALSLRTGAGDDQVSSGPISIESIIARICQEMTVSRSDLLGRGRQKKVVMARELIVHTARALTSKSFPEIAHAIGRPNHSTVITAAKRFKDRITRRETVAVGCPHDGVPCAELAQLVASRVHA